MYNKASYPGHTIPTVHKYATSEDQDEPVHPRSQIKVTTGRIKYSIYMIPAFYRAHSEDPDQPTRVRKLIQALAGRACKINEQPRNG